VAALLDRFDLAPLLDVCSPDILRESRKPWLGATRGYITFWHGVILIGWHHAGRLTVTFIQDAFFASTNARWPRSSVG
jgi:hypothetical protein